MHKDLSCSDNETNVLNLASYHEAEGSPASGSWKHSYQADIQFDFHRVKSGRALLHASSMEWLT